MKTQQSVAMNAIATMITFSSLGFPFDKILRVRKSIESLVQVLATANRIWDERENLRLAATVSGTRSHSWRFHPSRNWATSMIATKVVVGS
jgi:hypothetical protein